MLFTMLICDQNAREGIVARDSDPSNIKFLLFFEIQRVLNYEP